MHSLVCVYTVKDKIGSQGTGKMAVLAAIITWFFFLAKSATFLEFKAGFRFRLVPFSYILGYMHLIFRDFVYLLNDLKLYKFSIF